MIRIIVPNFYESINGQIDRKKTIIRSFPHEFEEARDKIRYKDLRDTDYCAVVEERDIPNIFFKIRSYKSDVCFSNIITIKDIQLHLSLVIPNSLMCILMLLKHMISSLKENSRIWSFVWV